MKKKIGSQKAHDDLEAKVEKALKNNGWENITRNTDYVGVNSKGNNHSGEVDIYATKHNKYLFVGEIKSGSQNAKKSDKAIGQLFRSITRYFNKVFSGYRSFPFYIHPADNDEPIYEHIKFGKACNNTEDKKK